MVWSRELRARRRVARRRAAQASVADAGSRPVRIRGRVRGDRLAGMEEIQVAALDRRLGLELVRPRRCRPASWCRARPSRGPAGPFELADDVVANPLPVARAAECASLVGIALDRVGRGARGCRSIASGVELPASHRIDLASGAAERGVDPGREVVDVRLEQLELAGAATIRPVPRRTTTSPAASAMNAAIGRSTAEFHRRVRPGRSARPGAKLFEEGRPDLEQVADDDQVRELGDGGVGIAVDGDDRAGGLHPDLVLDRAADAEREVQLGLDDLARLADLLAVRDPARIDSGAGRADGPAERLGEVARRARNRPAPPMPRPPDDDDAGLLDRGGSACLADTIDDADRREVAVVRRRSRAGAVEVPGRRSPRGGDDVGPTVMIPRPAVKPEVVMSLPPKTLISTTGPESPSSRRSRSRARPAP